MTDDLPFRYAAERRNAFGFLRLLFATLVIIAHTPELADGDRHREPLTLIFGTVSFGAFAVDGFFLISGYLIVKSWLEQPAWLPYLRKRVARIHPGFFVASCVSVLIVAPLGGADRAAVLHALSPSIMNMLGLQTPAVTGAFAGAPYPFLNGSMWTIAFEFSCYILVLALGLLGLFRRRWLIPLLAIVTMGIFQSVPDWLLHNHLPAWSGSEARPDVSWRLYAMFLTGGSFLLWADRIRFTSAGSIVAIVGLILCLFQAALAEPGIALFGGYLLFGFAQWRRSGLFSRINNRTDISYGVYLYAWPIENLLLWYRPHPPLALLGAATLCGALLCGWLSWHVVEKPALLRLR